MNSNEHNYVITIIKYKFDEVAKQLKWKYKEN